MNTLAKINRAKEEVAREILEQVYQIWEELNWEWDMADMYQKIDSYIRKEHLFESDYTRN